MILLTSILTSKKCRITLLLPISLTVTLVLGTNIAFATTDTPKIAEQCFVCHGEDGNSPNNLIMPRIAGQDHIYLTRQLYEFRKGARESARMSKAAKGLSDQEIDILARYFSKLPIHNTDKINIAKANLGKNLFQKCVQCHIKNARTPNSGIPRLAGQHADYMLKQLHAFRDGTRKGAFAPIMKRMIAEFSDAELEALSVYISSLGK